MNYSQKLPIRVDVIGFSLLIVETGFQVLMTLVSNVVTCESANMEPTANRLSYHVSKSCTDAIKRSSRAGMVF